MNKVYACWLVTQDIYLCTSFTPCLSPNGGPNWLALSPFFYFTLIIALSPKDGLHLSEDVDQTVGLATTIPLPCSHPCTLMQMSIPPPPNGNMIKIWPKMFIWMCIENNILYLLVSILWEESWGKKIILKGSKLILIFAYICSYLFLGKGSVGKGASNLLSEQLPNAPFLSMCAICLHYVLAPWLAWSDVMSEDHVDTNVIHELKAYFIPIVLMTLLFYRQLPDPGVSSDEQLPLLLGMPSKQLIFKHHHCGFTPSAAAAVTGSKGD